MKLQIKLHIISTSDFHCHIKLLFITNKIKCHHGKIFKFELYQLWTLL
jgi:hypothetical protein